jgi:O-antigen/teichoic acid export membrane protein
MPQIDMSARVSRNIASSYIAQLTSLIAAILLVPAFTHLLGQYVYGEWLIIYTIISSVYLTISGFDQTIANRIAEAAAANDQPRIVSTISTMVLLYAGLACLLTIAFSVLSPELCRLFVSHRTTDLAFAMRVLAILLALALPFRVHLMLLRGLERVYEEQRIAIAINLCRVVAIFAALFSGLRLIAVAAVYGLTTLGAGLIAYLRARRLSGAARPRLAMASVQTVVSLVKPSLAFALLQVVGTIAFGVDNLVIAYALGPEYVTKYAVAFNLIMVATNAYATLAASLLPTITRLYARNDTAAIRGVLSTLIRLAVLYSAAVGVLLCISGRYFVTWWAGAETYPGDCVFRLMIVLLITQVVILPPWMLLVATTQHYGTAAIHSVESLLNLALSLWWVHVWGLAGVIGATLVARIATTGWFMPLKAMWIMKVHFSNMRFALKGLALIPIGGGVIALGILGVAARESRFLTVPVPIAAISVVSILSVSLIYAMFSSTERKAAIDLAFGLLQEDSNNH